ncbi:unnamed protein product, partial [Durusdinium trenchii]
MKQQLQNQTPDQRRQSLLGDFPAAALKRTAEVEAPELAKRLKSGFYATLMVSLSQKELQEKRGRRPGHQHASEWLSRRELETLKEVVDLPVTAMIVEEKAAEVSTRPRRKDVQGAYVQHGDRLYQVPWPEERMYAWKNFVHQDRLARRACQIFLLKMKANGKELDPRHFSPDEKVQDDKSDEAEWLSWIRNKVVQLVPPERAKK